MTKWKHVINTSLLQPLMTQAFYDVLAIKPTYLGITLFPYSIITMKDVSSGQHKKTRQHHTAT